METRLSVNGSDVTLNGAGDRPLLWALHDELGLQGTGFNCLEGHCGSCTVLVDWLPVRACITPVDSVAGREIVTIEGVCASGHALCAAFSAAGLLDCTMCSSGQVMCGVSLLHHDATADSRDLTRALAENICYCLRYGDIQHALRKAVSDDADAAATSR